MSCISFLWLFLFGIRESLVVFTTKTTLLTAAITGLQFMDLFLLMQKDGWRFSRFHLLVPIFVALVPYNPGALVLVNITLAIILLKHIPFQKVAFVACLSMLVGLFIYLSGFNMGLAKDIVGISHKGGYFHTLGFKNPNTPGLAFMRVVLVTATFCLVTFRVKFPVYLFLIPAYQVYSLTKSRTSFLTLCIFFVLVFYFSFDRRYWLERKLAVALPFLLYAATFVLCAFYTLFPIVDIFFSRRFSFNNVTLGNLSVINYVIGSRFPEDSPLDSAYIVQMFNGGIFAVCLFLHCCAKGMARMSLKRAKIFLPYILCMLISGFSEDTFSMSYVSVILFYKMLVDQFALEHVRSRYAFALPGNKKGACL